MKKALRSFKEVKQKLWASLGSSTALSWRDEAVYNPNQSVYHNPKHVALGGAHEHESEASGHAERVGGSWAWPREITVRRVNLIRSVNLMERSW